MNLYNRNRNKIEPMNIIFFRSTKGKTRRATITNNICTEVGIQHLLKEKRLNLFGSIGKMDKTRIQRRALE
jgi:hypothetical protein